MCGRYALYGPISRHRKNRPIDELPEWYPGLVDSINARPMRFNVATADKSSLSRSIFANAAFALSIAS
jgi:hypothetical protein